MQTRMMMTNSGREALPADNAPDGKAIIERMLMRIRSTDEFPTVSKHLIEINKKISDNSDASSASELANVILQDFALTNQLLKLVNSAYYGFAAGKVSTVTRAVVVLGFEHVRLATLRLTLFDHFLTKGHPDHAGDLKEAIVTSFWAGVLARDIAKIDKTIDPEEAFVCAMLGQLGKLLMIYYLPGEYRKIQALMGQYGEGEAKAVKFICGISYEELGMAVAKQWNFPVQICDSMQLLSREALEDKHKPPAKLRALSSMVKELCAVVQENGAAANQAAYQRLLERYQSHIKIDKRQLKNLVIGSLDHLQDQATALDLNFSRSCFLKRLAQSFAAAKHGEEPEKVDASIKPVAESFQLSDNAKVGAGDYGTKAEAVILEGIQEISAAMMDTYEINDVIAMSLEILFRALNFKRALMFVQDQKLRMMTARFGYGDNSQALIDSLAFRVGAQKDLFNMAIQVGKDLIVADADDAKLVPLIPDWFRRDLRAPAFIFLPLVFQKNCIGAFYADRDSNGKPITEIEHRHLSMLRNQLILAIKYRR